MTPNDRSQRGTAKARSIRVWGTTPAGTTHAPGEEPGSRGFFEKVLAGRNEYEIPWLFDLVPFSSFRGMSVLEVGCGAGYDAYTFFVNGANYLGLDIVTQNAQRTRKHLSYYGYHPKVLVGDAEALPLREETYDIVYSNGVLHHTPDIETSFTEARRVLRSGGRFWVVVYHRNSIFHWLTLFVRDHILGGGFRKRTFRERLSMIEYTTSGELPLVNVYSRQQLRSLLRRAGFLVEKIWVRRLLPEEMPSLPLIGRIWRFIPMPIYRFLGKAFGWYVIAEAKKI